MTSLQVKFGHQLRRLRRQTDMTQEQLAETAGVSTDLISNIERGINAPSFRTLEKLAGALNVSVIELFNFEFSE